MLKWILAILVVALLLKRKSVSVAVTTANSAPPEGNIDSWANSGSQVTGMPDSHSFYKNGATAQGGDIVPLSPTRIAPNVNNFRTRGFYGNGTRYAVPGRS